jgi:hypothetical protein
VELAAERSFKIGNPDLQDSIAAERGCQQRAEDLEQALADVRSTSGSNALAVTYRPHFEDIIRNQPRRRAMTLRGWMQRPRGGDVSNRPFPRRHRAGDPAQRSRCPTHHVREWKAYAERAADFITGAPVHQLRDQLVNQA